MPKLHLCTDSGRNRNKLPIRARNETNAPIHFFGPNSDVLVRFGQFRYCAINHAKVAFKAPIRAGTVTSYRFGPETKRTHPIHFFGPNSDVLVRFGQFRYCAKNHAKVAFMHRFGPEPKRTTDSGQKRNERTQSTFLDPIVMFWFVLVSFVTVQKTMPKLHLCTDSGRNRNELPIRARNETNAPNPLFWTQ